MSPKRARRLANKESAAQIGSGDLHALAVRHPPDVLGRLPAGQSSKQVVQHSDIERLHALTAKLERSAGEFITARKRLEEIVAAEGNAELNDFLAKGSADLNTELARNRELTSRAELELKGEDSHPSPHKGCACVDVVDVLEEVRRHVVSMSSRGRRVRLKGLNQLDGAEVGSSYDFLKSIMG